MGGCVECAGELQGDERKLVCRECGTVYEQMEIFGGDTVVKRTASQIGRHARKKGLEGKSEFAKLIGGEVVTESGTAGGNSSNSVHLPNGMQAEVKRFKEGEKTLYSWIEERPDLVGFRADDKPWIVAMYAPKFKLLMDIQIAAENVAKYTEEGFPSPVYIEEFMDSMNELQRLLKQTKRQSELAEVINQ